MRTLDEVLRDEDPLAHEPRRGAQERHTRRQTMLDAAQVGDHAPQGRRVALATFVALAMLGIALASLHWSRTVVEAVAAVRFEVRLAEENPAAGLREVVIAETSRKLYLHSEPVVANSDIVEARVVQGDGASVYWVSVTFNAEGAAKMLNATKGHVDRPLAILIDGEVVVAPVVRSPITASAIISGNFARAEAERIVGGILGR